MGDPFSDSDPEAWDAAPPSPSPTTSSATTLDDATIKASDFAQRGLTYYTPSPDADSFSDSPDAYGYAPNVSEIPKTPPTSRPFVNLPYIPSASSTSPVYETLPDVIRPSTAPGAALTLLAAPSIPGLDVASASASTSPNADPLAAAQRDYQSARQAAGQSIVETRQKLANLGFSVPDDALADPAALHTAIQSRINAALAEPEANQVSPFGPARLTLQSQQLRNDLADLGNRAASIVSDHADTLDDLRGSYGALQSASRPATAGSPASASPDQGAASPAQQPAPSTDAQPTLTSPASQPPAPDAPFESAQGRRRAPLQLPAAPPSPLPAPGAPFDSAQGGSPAPLQQPSAPLTPPIASPTPPPAQATPQATPPPAQSRPIPAPTPIPTQSQPTPRPTRPMPLPPPVPAIPGMDHPPSAAPNSFPAAQEIPGAITNGSIPQGGITNGQPTPGLITNHSSTPAPPPSPPRAPFQPADAPYRVEDDGMLSFDPKRLTDGVRAAYQAGNIDQDKFNELLPKAQAAEKAMQEQQKLVETNPVARRLMAVGHGAATGAAFLAGAPVGAEAGAAIGAFFGPADVVTVPLGAAIGGAITGGIASWGASKILQKLGEYSDTVKAFNDAAEAHPYYDAAGNLISIGGGLPKAVTGVAAKGLNALAGEGESLAARGLRGAARAYERGSPGVVQSFDGLARDWANRGVASFGTKAAGLSARVAQAAAANLAIDTTIKEGAHALGISQEGQTLSGAVQALVIGGIMSGHGITLNNIPHEVATDVTTRGAIRDQYGLSSQEALSPEQIAARFPAADAVTAHALSHPLDPSERELYNSVTAQFKAARDRGETLGPDPQITARQALTGGQPYGNTRVELTPSHENAPQTVAQKPPPGPRGLAAPGEEQPAVPASQVATPATAGRIAPPGPARSPDAATAPDSLSNAGAPPSARLIAPSAGSDTRPAAETTSPMGGAVSPAPSSSAAPPPVPERPWGVTQADRGTPVESRSGITGTLGDANSQKAAIRDANGQDHLFDSADVRPAAPNVPRGTAPNPGTLAANPGPCGAITDAHRGLPVETKDGRTGTLLAGPLPDTPNANIAILDAAGKSHVVPQAETRLAGSAGQDTSPTEGSTATPATPAHPNTPTNPSPWGAVTDAHRGLPVETKDGRSGTLLAGPLPDTPDPNVAIQDAAGNSHVVPQAETRLAGPAGDDTAGGVSTSANGGGDNTPSDTALSMGAGNAGLPKSKTMSDHDMVTLWDAIFNKKAEMAARYSKLGIVPDEEPTRRFAVRADASGNITPNLPEDALMDHAIYKSRGDLQSALEVVHNLHEEEYYHTIDLLKLREEWSRQGGDASGQGFGDYVNAKNKQLQEEVVDHINELTPPRQKEAIRDMADMLRHYDVTKYGDKGDTELWNDLQNDPETRNAFVNEAVRQLAHYGNDNTNSETNYLKTLNANKYRGRAEFYKQKVFQVDLNEFGPQIRDRVRQVAAKVRAEKAVVP